MAIDCFLKLDSINGEATDDRHKDEIQVLSWGMGITFMHDASQRAGTGGRSEFSNLSITKTADLSSCKLFLCCASGLPIETAKLSLQSSTGKAKTDILTIEMDDVRVTSISPGGSGDMPMESVTFSYGTIKWAYTQLDHTTGANKGSDNTGWDLREKKKL